MFMADRERLGGRQLERELLRPIVHQLERLLIDFRRDRAVLDPGSLEHLMTDRTGRGEDQWQLNNLVEKWPRNATANRGTVSIELSSEVRVAGFEDSSTGTNSIPKL
jgi:hypothetical protein